MTPAEDTFQKKNQAVTLGLKSSSVKIDGRLTLCSSDDLEPAFKHELCSYPSALFDSSLLLREADKPALADAIWKICEREAPADMNSEWWSTSTMHSMVPRLYTWRHLPPVHRICSKKVQECHSCV